MIKHGFEIIYAEKLSLKDQISLMSETRTVVSLHGAALTNMIFLPENSEVIELRNFGDSKTNCYFNLANALGLKYYYTLNKGNSADSITADFTIDLKALENVIRQLKD
jgi:capsular polysaccharide biosynthesis protein